jgi:hypothetical protein
MDQFWELIECTRQKSNIPKEQMAFFVDTLKKEPIDKTLTTIHSCHQCFIRLNNNQQAIIVYLLNLDFFNLDRVFIEYKSWVIMQGKEFFEYLIECPKLDWKLFIDKIDPFIESNFYELGDYNLLEELLEINDFFFLDTIDRIPLLDLYESKYGVEIIGKALSLDHIGIDLIADKQIIYEYKDLILYLNKVQKLDYLKKEILEDFNINIDLLN